jgi:hypothetical protein
MTRPEGRKAFDLKDEPLAVRERYGMHPLGQNLLLARRMVEAGVRFITVNGWVGAAPDEKGGGPPSSSWDMHGGNMGMGNAFGAGSYGMNFCLPRLDQALSALLTDLKQRGLLEDTLVVAVGEFGRTPIILTKGPPGRQHWPKCFSAIVAGCGIRGGAVYGESDKTASAPVSDPVTVQDLHATVLHASGRAPERPRHEHRPLPPALLHRQAGPGTVRIGIHAAGVEEAWHAGSDDSPPDLNRTTRGSHRSCAVRRGRGLGCAGRTFVC